MSWSTKSGSLEILKEKFLWKIRETVELTGPATFSDAVHEFLAEAVADGVQMEVSDRVNASEERRSLSFPSERAYSVAWPACFFVQSFFGLVT